MPEIPPPPAHVRYRPVVSQGAATIAELRAAPPPREPDISRGGTVAGDEQMLNSRGYARIGDGYVDAEAGDPLPWLVEEGRRVGADKVRMYPPNDEGTTHAAFYVRYRLPFGATFRTVSDDERKELGTGGVQIGDVVGGTPASEANLRRGDFVVRFDGRSFAGRPAFEQLLRDHLGRRVTLTISRNGVEFERLVRLGVIAKPAGDAGD
jgi:PDZ domain